MFKWVEIGLENNRPRFELLSEYLREIKFENSVEFIQTSIEDFPKVLEDSLKKFDGIRIGRGLGEVVVPMFVRHATTVGLIRAADAIVKIKDLWWLRSNAVDGFSRVLTRFGESFDFLTPVLIVGAGAASRVAVTSLFKIGFRSFAISSLNVESVEKMISDLKRNFFGVDFKVVLKEELILLPGTHGILVNTTPLMKDNPMFDELYYFNFFSSGGLAIDFAITPVETPLLKAALDVGAKVLYGYQISASTDIIWCEQITGRNLSGEGYEVRLKQKLSV